VQFRDFRHQIEPNEDMLSDRLQAAANRFQDNLALLQLQQPELTKQLREFEPNDTTLCVDRAGDIQLLNGASLQFVWPPRELEPNYQPLIPKLKPQAAAIIAIPLQLSGNNVLQLLATQHAPMALIYVPDLLILYASLHAYDWRPVLKHTQFIFQIGESIQLIEADLEVLAKHGMNTKPCTVVQALPERVQEEAQWHFQEALRWCHDCDPVLRVYTHKFRSHYEFRWQNKLIHELRQQPNDITNPTTIFLAGLNFAVLRAAIETPHVKTIICLSVNAPPESTPPIPKVLQNRADAQGVNVVVWKLSKVHFGAQFAAKLRALPPATAWMCRLYQAGNTPSDREARMLAELELRYWVQPQFGISRTLAWLIHSQAVAQHFLTRRSQWPEHQSEPLPAIILGNGPSLNDTIRQLKEQPQPNLVVISCGSAIKTLANHGLVPDIHLELELNSGQLNELPEVYYKQVQLIAPAGFHAPIRARFEHHASLLLANHMLDDMLPGVPDDTLRIPHAFPTVVNLAVRLCAAFAVKTVYLSGADFAFQSLESHHAQGSHYDQQGAQQYATASGELIKVQVGTRELLTKREFMMAAQELASAVQEHKSTEYISLSSGLDFGAAQEVTLPCFDSIKTEKKIQRLSERTIAWRKKFPHMALPHWITKLEQKTEDECQQILQANLSYPHHLGSDKNPVEYWLQPFLRNYAALWLKLTPAQRNNPEFNSLWEESLLHFQKLLARI